MSNILSGHSEFQRSTNNNSVETPPSKSLEQEALKHAMNNCISCNDPQRYAPCICSKLEVAYIAGAHHSPGITEEIIAKLEEANPWPNDPDDILGYDKGYKECISTLRGLLNDKTKTKGE